METTQQTNSTKVEVTLDSHSVPAHQKEVLATISHRPTVTNKKSQPKKSWRPAFKKKQIVYFTAFLKENKKIFYVCKGEVQEIPGPNERQVYKIKIVAVADRPVGGQPIIKQARLLGLVVTKRTREITRDLSPFMAPSGWIDKIPNDLKYEHNSVDFSKGQRGKVKDISKK